MKNPIVLAAALCAASTFAAAQQAPASGFSASSARIQAMVAGGAPGFDSSSRDGADAVLPDAPVPARLAKPKPTALEKDLYWSTSMAYHAAFAADFASTGMILGRGGYETDPLYTRFGNKNMKGVIGSAVALHAIASVGSYALYKEAEKKHGFWRHALMAGAVGINAVGIESHVQGVAHNAVVLNDWKK